MISITSIIPTKHFVISSIVTFAFGYFFPYLVIFLCSFGIGKELAQYRKNKTAQKLKKEFYSRKMELNND